MGDLNGYTYAWSKRCKIKKVIAILKDFVYTKNEPERFREAARSSCTALGQVRYQDFRCPEGYCAHIWEIW